MEWIPPVIIGLIVGFIANRFARTESNSSLVYDFLVGIIGFFYWQVPLRTAIP